MHVWDAQRVGHRGDLIRAIIRKRRNLSERVGLGDHSRLRIVNVDEQLIADRVSL